MRDPHAAAVAILTHLPENDARRLLIELGKRSVLRALERENQRREARRLLDQRIPRPMIRERLQAQGISKRTAQRVIGQVLRNFRPDRREGAP